MTARRPNLPTRIEANVLFDNDHTCCICRASGKDVQTHHIDGNTANNDPANLAILCLDCHSRVTGTRGLGKRYSPVEVRKYKRDWESIVRKKRSLTIEPLRKLDKSEVKFTKFEVKKNLYELSATKNPVRAKEILDLLDMYHIFEGQTDFILETLRDLVPFFNNPTSSLVAEHLLHYFWHLGPDRSTKIDKKDIQSIEKAIDILKWMGEFATYAPIQGISTTRDAVRALYSLFVTVSNYPSTRVQTKIQKAIQFIKQKALTSGILTEQEKANLVVGMDSILQSIREELPPHGKSASQRSKEPSNTRNATD